MMIESAAISETINSMYDFATTAEIPELDESVMKRIANNAAFIKSRENEVIEGYSALGFKLEQRKNKGEWVAISMRKV